MKKKSGYELSKTWVIAAAVVVNGGFSGAWEREIRETGQRKK